jgi:exo-beta-1,3-glucanase (GH17 family)
MDSTRWGVVSIKTVRTCCWIGAALCLFLLTSCGGSGSVPDHGAAIRPLSTEMSTRKAVAYSPYRTNNRGTETVTAANITQDLNLLVQGNFRLIRLFDSSDNVSKQTLQIIKSNNLDIKVMLGVYIQSGDDAFNRAEIARGITLANQYPDIVLTVSVGNENMVSWSFNSVSPAVMGGYITTVRSAVAQPVTSDDNWAFYASAPQSLLDQIDFVSMHTYSLIDSVQEPFLWDWTLGCSDAELKVNPGGCVPAALRAAAMMDASIAVAQSNYAAVSSYLNRARPGVPIVIGETGWKAIASGGETYRAHPVNQKMYYDRLAAWGAAVKAGAAGPGTIVYFEAFDEPWKGGDDKWGLFNVARQARYVIQALYPASQWEAGTGSGTGGAYTLADAQYYIPLSGASPGAATYQYTLYADMLTAGEVRPLAPNVPTWNAWGGATGPTASYSQLQSSPPSWDSPNYLQVTPNPAASANPPWGWGLFQGWISPAFPTFQYAEDLSAFNTSTGMLNFSISTTYPCNLAIGFGTGRGVDNTAFYAYYPLGSGNYGYFNDGSWHRVSIPISEIIKTGKPSFPLKLSTLDMTRVTSAFIIEDAYADTLNSGSPCIGNTTQINIDNIYWSR